MKFNIFFRFRDVELQDAFASFITVLDWHVQVEDDQVEEAIDGTNGLF